MLLIKAVKMRNESDAFFALTQRIDPLRAGVRRMTTRSHVLVLSKPFTSTWYKYLVLVRVPATASTNIFLVCWARWTDERDTLLYCTGRLVLIPEVHCTYLLCETRYLCTCTLA